MTQATFVIPTISAALFLYRLCAGPSLADRVIALNGLVLVGMGGIATHAAHTAIGAFLPALEAGKPSHVVNVTSVAGTVAVPPGLYSATKHALVAFSRVS